MTATRPLDEAQVRTSLGRFKAASIVEGVALLILVVIMIFRYLVFGGVDANPIEAQRWATISKTWSPIHGVIYIAYVVLAFDLWLKMRWQLPRMLLLMFFGVVPVLSFFGEKWTTQQVEKDLRERPTLGDSEPREAR